TMYTLQIGMGWFPEQAGGLNRVYHNLIRVLPKEGVGVQGLVSGTPEVAEQTGGRVEAFAASTAPLPIRWRAARRHALRRMAARPPDLIASHFTLYTAPLGRHLRAQPLVMHFHGPWAAESAVAGGGHLSVRVKAAIERRVYRHARRFIVLSEAFRDVLHRTYGVSHERIRVVPGGVDSSRFALAGTRAEARARLGWPTDRPLILAVRRLQRRMGIEALLTAMKAVRAAVPDVLLLIAGTGPLAPELEARIDALGLRQHVRLLGYLLDETLPHAYRAADLTVVPTAALEGFGLITVESLAAGTPVLVTPVGGLPEVVRGLSEHLVLGGHTAEALAEGLTDALLGARPLPDATACRAYAEARFSWPMVARQVRAVYEEALG
ncbi:MAG TPA: glycosyltransferase family 4 protein, partial [Rubricoccaceae bacterium]|nr:glycosyltransferase family 4 protein [Rubricoccaceae bacterium]